MGSGIKSSCVEGGCKFILNFLELSKGKTVLSVSKCKDAMLVLWYLL